MKYEFLKAEEGRDNLKVFSEIKYKVAKLWHLRLCLSSVATSSLTSWVIKIKYMGTVFNYLVKEDRSAFRKLVYINHNIKWT